MSSRTVRRYKKEDRIICTYKNEEYRGMVTDYKPIKGDGANFYVYYVDLFAKKVKKDDTSPEMVWETVMLKMDEPVSDLSLRPYVEG